MSFWSSKVYFMLRGFGVLGSWQSASSAAAVQRQHRLLGLVECLCPGRVVGTGILKAAAKAMLEKGRRQFVVLSVGGIGVDGKWAETQLPHRSRIAHPVHRCLPALFLRSRWAHRRRMPCRSSQSAPPRSAQPSRPGAAWSRGSSSIQCSGGSVSHPFPVVSGSCSSRLGNQGNSIGVRRW